ncbi:MAG: extracellular solute-binding protein [Pirellulales bacterium]|nr:extracellular solute-binding protein [Pirellulales bacterium]
MGAAVVIAVLGVLALLPAARSNPVPPGRTEVVFWHKWGGGERHVVQEIADRFNDSQDEYFVRPIVMPGNNLDLKFFLSYTGGDPPDLLVQDGPVVADWASRGALLAIDEVATAEEVQALDGWLFPAARQLGTFDDRLYALANGLDIRLLYYDQRKLDVHGLKPPKTLADLDHIADTIAPPETERMLDNYGYLPDPRRIWAWGIVFGGRFYDEATGEVTADREPIVRALEWMKSYATRYGADNVLKYRTGDQSLAGKEFPLLRPKYGYAVLMDGQWRVREMIAAAKDAQARGEPEPKWGVVPLPPPEDGLHDAGWVNGNLFIVPRGSRNAAGAWAFMKFWSGFAADAASARRNEAEAARACIAGGWVPASQAVVDSPEFQAYLKEAPQFAEFLRMAGSKNQIPVPTIVGAAYFRSEIEKAAAEAIYRGKGAREVLEAASERVRKRLAESSSAR